METASKGQIQFWQHKESKKKVRALPWWEILPDDEIMNSRQVELGGPAWKFGMLVQVGWLLENEHGVWLGVGPKAIEAFNIVGPEKKKSQKKDKGKS